MASDCFEMAELLPSACHGRNPHEIALGHVPSGVLVTGEIGWYCEATDMIPVVAAGFWSSQVNKGTQIPNAKQHVHVRPNCVSDKSPKMTKKQA